MKVVPFFGYDIAKRGFFFLSLVKVPQALRNWGRHPNGKIYKRSSPTSFQWTPKLPNSKIILLDLDLPVLTTFLPESGLARILISSSSGATCLACRIISSIDMSSESSLSAKILHWKKIQTFIYIAPVTKKCNLTLAISPTWHSNNTITICWCEFFWECSQSHLAQCQIYKRSMVLSASSYKTPRVPLMDLDLSIFLECILNNMPCIYITWLRAKQGFIC